MIKIKQIRGLKEQLYTYIYEQITPSNTWNINHNLNKFPSVTIVDSANNIVYGEIQYIDENNIQIIFSNSFAGKVYLN